MQPAKSPQTAIDVAAITLAFWTVALQAWVLGRRIFEGGSFDLGLANVLALLGWQIAVIALIATGTMRYRGLAAILLLLAAALSTAGFGYGPAAIVNELGIPLKIHAMTSLVAYSLIAVGAVLATAALAQDRRLRKAATGGWIRLLPSLLEMERLVFGLATVGFVGLLISILTGLVFVEDLFAQHLIHKTVLSLAALLLFGGLLTARLALGWRGRSALYLYLGGFATLLLAYFGSKFVLEVLLGRSWS